MKNTRILSLAIAAALSAGLAHAQLKAPPAAATSRPATGIKPAPVATETAAAPLSDEQSKEAAGQLAAAAWLSLLDRRDWGRAWDGSSAVFRTTVPLGAWMDGIPKVREPLGALEERSPLDAVHKTELAGRPAGDYVTVSFSSKFSNKPDAEEVVTTVLEADGKWRVTGYQTR